MTLGAKQHTYELVPGWAKLPHHVQLGYTHAVICDRQGRIFVFNQSPHAMAIFDPTGRFVTSWGAPFAHGAHGMCCRIEQGSEVLYLADYEIPLVAKFTLDGAELLRLPTPPVAAYADGGYKPTHVCVAPSGEIYTFDGYGKHLVHRFDATGKHLNSFGGQGAAAGQLNCPHGGCLVERPGQPLELYVADRANVRIQVFTPEGVHKRSITGEGLKYPCNLLHAYGDLYIPDLFGVVTIWGPDDRLVAQLGANPDIPEVGGWPKLADYPNLPQEQRVAGRFIAPHGVCLDRERNLVVVEWVSDGRITKLERTAAPVAAH